MPYKKINWKKKERERAGERKKKAIHTFFRMKDYVYTQLISHQKHNSWEKHPLSFMKDVCTK